jgi:acyl carrier protein
MVTTEDIIKIIAASGIEVETANLRDNENLYTQGFDSLDMANLELQIEQRYGIDISSQQLQLNTIVDFVGFLNAKLSSSADHWH